MLIVGVTGVMGSGKTTVSRFLEALGAYRLDADQLARQAILPHTPGYHQVVARFGGGVLDEQGVIVRHRLAQLAFADDQGIADLEAIIHPCVARLQAGALSRLGVTRGVAALEVPLLFESGGHRLCDRTVVVTCGTQQASRVSGRPHGLSSQVVARMMARQLPEKEKCGLATDVIDNRGTLAETYRQVERLWVDFSTLDGRVWPGGWDHLLTNDPAQ